MPIAEPRLRRVYRLVEPRNLWLHCAQSLDRILRGSHEVFAIARHRRPKPSKATTPCWNNRLWRHNLNQMASGKPGAVQIELAQTLRREGTSAAGLDCTRAFSSS